MFDHQYIYMSKINSERNSDYSIEENPAKDNGYLAFVASPYRKSTFLFTVILIQCIIFHYKFNQRTIALFLQNHCYLLPPVIPPSVTLLLTLPRHLSTIRHVQWLEHCATASC